MTKRESARLESSQGGEAAPPWTVEAARTAEWVLERLPWDLVRDIDARLVALAYNPRPDDCHVLHGSRALSVTVRHGWRILYTVADAARRVLVAKIGPRGGVYRNR